MNLFAAGSCVCASLDSCELGHVSMVAAHMIMEVSSTSTDPSSSSSTGAGRISFFCSFVPITHLIMMVPWYERQYR
jgi:hypothetical protein